MATIEDVLSRQERIEKLFNQLVDSIELNQDMLEEYAKELCDVYSDIIFLLLYCVSKISGRSISVNCKKRNCADCKSCRTNFGRLHKKYPYIFWFNIMGVFFCTILCIIAMRA